LAGALASALAARKSKVSHSGKLRPEHCPYESDAKTVTDDEDDNDDW
jgi:hypothetical protein